MCACAGRGQHSFIEAVNQHMAGAFLPGTAVDKREKGHMHRAACPKSSCAGIMCTQADIMHMTCELMCVRVQGAASTVLSRR